LERGHIDGLFSSINNLFDFAGQTTAGVAAQGTNVGKFGGVFIILVGVVVVLGLAWKIVKPAVHLGGRYI
jgi:hypothetical protein